MNRAIRIATVALAAFSLLAASTASATSMVKMSLRDLAKKSDTIVLARVEDETARYDANKEIYSYYTLRVLEPVKGARGETTITVRQIGGVVDNIASIVPGTPTFRKGEEVVVFLTSKDAAGYPWVMGLQQGKYSVVADENGTKHVRNELDGLNLMGADGSKSEGRASTDVPLQAFLDGIRTDLNEAGKVQVDPTTPTE
jgi:hypothetical protein